MRPHKRVDQHPNPHPYRGTQRIHAKRDADKAEREPQEA
ncbi:hypothetical protein VO64_0817 [Pseudomonas synxantha]|uniref:Uncharacterized protein n=1 Tax=Pseudomonas synxantha TaxID=47883 RepID=A0AAU8TFF8_9PSED|nr:hypothetical protein VO64_0817 [Pseudomonas synxantha]